MSTLTRPQRARRWLIRFLALGLLSVFATWIYARYYYTRISLEDARSAILHTDILGSSPAEVEALLNRVVLPGERRFSVGSFSPGTSSLTAVVGDAHRRAYQIWDLHAVVRFDSVGRAAALDVYYSAVNPL